MATYRRRGKRWQAQVCINGKRQAKTFDRKHLAVEWANDVEADVSKLEPDNITLAALVEKYTQEVSIYHKGKKQEILRLNRIVQFFPDVPIAKLRKDQFSAWKNELLQNRKPGTVRRYMTALNAVFNHAVDEWGYLYRNPMAGVKKPPDDPHRERYPSSAEVSEILEALNYKGRVEAKQHEIAISFLIAIETAMRAGEILSIRPENTDLKKRVVTLVNTKNGDTRHVPLSGEAVKLIKLLPGRRFTVSSAVHSKLFSKAVKKAGIRNLRFHDSRAAGLMKLSKKVDVLTLARIVGHRDTRSLMVYYRANAEDIAKLL